MFLNNGLQAAQQMNEYGQKGIPFFFVLDFELKKPFVCPLKEIEKENIAYYCNPNHYFLPWQLTPKKKFELQKIPRPFAEYQQKFEKIQSHIQRGDTYLLNLSVPTPLNTNASLQEIFMHSQARYKLYFKDQFVCFSPEIFVQIQQQQIASYPMKGTIDASLPNALQQIQENEKEIAEHYTIVDLIRNDLSRVAQKVRVEKFRYIEKIITHQKTLLQVSSKIVGELSPNYPSQIGTLLLQLLPAGSISGAPKKKTVEIITQTEQYERGYYTGIFGYFDGISLDSAVMIRFIEKQPDQTLLFKSGGGITYHSDATQEYQEMIDKIYFAIPQ
ncbi:MAG: aminodeoxychorismate synthase component I [Cytophagales bacterium]|nr:MAG: aminodeoxychorismate synthase component I [Cytophagales bacterium]